MSESLSALVTGEVTPQLDSVALTALVDAIAALGAARSRDEVVQALRSHARMLIGAGGIAVIFREGDLSYYVAEDAHSPLWAGQRFPMSQCASGLAMQGGQTIVINDALADARLPTEVYASTFVRSLAIAPMSPNAALGAYWAQTGAPDPGSILILETLARSAATALENARLFETMAKLQEQPSSANVIHAQFAPEQNTSFSTQDALVVFDHLPVLAWIADPNGYIFRYNRAWHEYTGTTLDEMKGWGWQSVHDPLRLPDVVETWHSALQSGEPFEDTFPLRGADGVFRPFLTRAVPQRDASGAIVRWFGTNTDVSAIEAAEQEAERSQKLLQNVVDHVPSAVYVKDIEGRFKLANKAALDIIGVPWDQLEGQTDAFWLSGEPLQTMRANDSAVLQGGMTLEIEEEAPFPSPETPTIYLSRKAPMRGPDGEIMGLIGCSIDITEKRVAHDALATREAYLKNVLDQLFAFVGVTTLDGTLTFTNTAPLIGADLKPEDVWGRPFWECYWWSWNPDSQALCRDAVRDAAAGAVVRRDLVVRMAGDTLISIDYQAAPLRDETGAIVAIIHSGVDIEARVQAQGLKDLLIGELHHRVNNLFTLITAMVEMTSHSAPDPATMAKVVNGRIMALAHAHSLIRPAPGANVTDSETDLATLVERVLAPYGSRRCHIDGPRVTLGQKAVTPVALIFHELATNAAKYGALSRSGGNVQLAWHIDGDELRLIWTERGGPPVTTVPSLDGFGSELLHLSAQTQLGGAIQKTWSEAGLEAAIMLPLSQLQ